MIKNKQRTSISRYDRQQQKDLDELLVITMEECAVYFLSYMIPLLY